MTVKSIIELDVDAQQFVRFKAMWDAYNKSLGQSPGVWKKATKEASGLSKAFDSLRTNLLGYPRTMKLASDEGRVQLRQLQQSERLWVSMSRKTKDVAENIFTATRHLLGWSGLLSIGSGLLGAGSLFGLTRLAETAGNERRSSMGLGMSIGQQRAFQINFSRLVDPDAFLGWVNQMETDPTKAWSAQALGVRPTGNTESDALAVLKALQARAKATPSNLLGLLPKQFGLSGVSGEDLNRLQRMPTSEFNELLAGNARDIGRVNIADETAKKWQDLMKTLEEAKSSIFATLVKGLAPLAGPLEHLSEAATKFVGVLLKSDLVKTAIEGLAHWLETFSGSISAPKFLDDVKRFTSDVGDLADAVHAVTYAVTHPAAAAAKARDNMASWMGEKFMQVFRPDEYYKYSGKEETNKFLSRIDEQNDLPPGTMARLWQAESSSSYEGKTSFSGAVGPFQFMPRTADSLGVDPRSFSSSASGAGYLLFQLRKKYGNDFAAALAAYNGVGSKDAFSGKGDPIYQKYGSLENAVKLNPGNWQAFLTPGERQYISGIAGSANVNISVNVTPVPGHKIDVAASQVAH